METVTENYTLIVRSENEVLFERVIVVNAGYDLFNNIDHLHASEMPAIEKTDTIQLYRNFSAMSAKILVLELYIYEGHTEYLVKTLLKMFP